jgi:hypothetical protein
VRKTHFSIDPANSLAVACGRTVNDHGQTPFTDRVTCLACQSRSEYLDQKVKDAARKHERFMAQTPRRIQEPWHEDGKLMVCRECGNDTFRIGDRTCYGHYQNYHCADCAHVESRLTETGMSF